MKMPKNYKTNGAYTESADLIFKAFKKNYSSHDTVPLISQNIRATQFSCRQGI